MARGGVGFRNYFRDEPEGLEGVTGGRAWPVSAGWGPLGGGGDVSGLLEGSGGGKINGLGWRGVGSRGCRVAIVAHIHGLFTVGGGIG